MKSLRNSVIPTFLALIASCAVLFQNCSEAGPPDTGLSNQSSYIAPSQVGQPSSTATATPIPTSGPPVIVVATPTPTATPTPPPMTQTYAWSIGTFGACDGTNQTRTVVCKDSIGNTVPDNNCATPKPATSQGCMLTYTCAVTEYYTTHPTYTSSGSSTVSTPVACVYTCTGPTSYGTTATNVADCNANPIGVAGTETGTTNQVQVSRPFTTCIVTQQLTQVGSDRWAGQSRCN